MKRPLYAVVFLLLAAIVLLFFAARFLVEPPIDSNSGTPADSAQTPAAESTGDGTTAGNPVGSTRPASIQPPARVVRVAQFADLPPSVLGHGVVLDSRDSAPDSKGRFRREQLVEVDFKYPYWRVSATMQRDAATGAERVVAQEAHIADQIMVGLKAGVTEARLAELLRRFGLTVRQRIPGERVVYVLGLEKASLDAVPNLLQQLKTDHILSYSEPDYIVHAVRTPNDPSFSLLWGMNNTGQTGGVTDADIDAPEAWSVATGSRSVVVGIIDTGISRTHHDLSKNIWTNPGEIAGNGVDDDGNGYVDDTTGWDFYNNDNDPTDDNNHGTHCAGTIGAVGNNGNGIAGVCWQVSLAALKFLNSSGSGSTSDAVAALNYATAKGISITSNSWGGGGNSVSLMNAIDAAGANGYVFVAAAGNNGTDIDSTSFYPASYTSTNLIAVAATDASDQLSSFSNYGAASVDLGAPGSGIYSTIPGNGYATYNGTSMATPHVAGACALLKSLNASLTAGHLKNFILANVDPLPALSGKCVSGGRLNLYKAVIAVDFMIVSPTTGISSSGPLGGPFLPSSDTYSVSNTGSSSINWSVSVNVPWVSLSKTGGVLARGDSTTVTASLNASATSLPYGTSSGTVTFIDNTTGVLQTRTVSVTIDPPVAYSFPLDTDPEWTRQGQWQFGKPTGSGGTQHGNADPSSGATGQNIFGVNLAGDYSTAVGGPYALTVGPFDFSGYTSVQLRFKRWLNSDWQPYVIDKVEASKDGTSWTSVWANGSSEIRESSWSLQQYNLSAFADNSSTVYIRWTYQVAASAWAYSGWNIDDIEFRGVPSPDADSDHDGLPDAWELSAFGTLSFSKTDDNDLDGTSNLMEWALGMDPTVASPDGLPALTRVLIAGNEYLALNYTPNPDATGLTFIVEVSNDLINWFSGPGYTVTVGSGPPVIVRDVLPIGNQHERFIRLRVLAP